MQVRECEYVCRIVLQLILKRGRQRNETEKRNKRAKVGKQDR